MLAWLFVLIVKGLDCQYNVLPMLHCWSRWPSKLTADEDWGVKLCRKGWGRRSGEAGLLYLTCGRGGGLAAHAGRVDWFRWDQIQVLVVWYLIEAVTIFQELDVQILIDLLVDEMIFVSFPTLQLQVKTTLQQWLIVKRSNKQSHITFETKLCNPFVPV